MVPHGAGQRVDSGLHLDDRRAAASRARWAIATATAMIGNFLRKGVMMKRWVKCLVGVSAVLLVGATAQAELKLVANFDGMTGAPDGQACNGVLGGTIDTESEGTGNSSLPAVNGSVTLSVIGHSSGASARAIGFGGITNPIADGETGIGFFRFMMATGGIIRPHMGLIAETGNNPINSARTADPKMIPAGFRLVENGAGFDLVTVDGATVLKNGLARSQWYNVWIVADHAADTFDLYLSKATGPAGAPTLPGTQDLVQSGILFAVATPGPLNGMIFANPVSPTGSGQATRIYVDEIWWDGDQGLSKPVKASNASPADRGQDVPREVVLGWTPGPTAATHDVYFGTDPNVVANADRTSPSNMLLSKGQTATTFDPTGSLELGRTYYWRVDEVNAAPDSTVFKGSVWSFTVEPVSYQIPKLTATASSATASMGPEKTVDGSGLNNNGQHATESSQMWLSATGAAQPTWIQYEFDGIYRVHQLVVWNSNQMLEPVLGVGAKKVTVEYSTDAAVWTKLGEFEFARAPGTATYAGNDAVSFGGAVAKYIRLTIHSNWGGVLQQYGLSEVRFFYIPVLPREPMPAVAQKNVEVDSALTWRAGREAASHQVYFGTDQQAVSTGTAPVKTVTAGSFDPGGLDLGKTYFWKVTEVNDAQTPRSWEGSVWSFSTREYLVIEDFESYTDKQGNSIFDIWVDGMTNSNGSIVGLYPDAIGGTFCEKTIVHGGKQSGPFEYNNVKTPYYSEAQRTFDTPQDWTAHGADTLTLWYRGFPTGFVDKGNDAFSVSSTGSDIWNNSDQFRFVFKSLSGNGSITARVDSLTRNDPWTKVGVMIRETLEAGSRHASMEVTPDNSCSFQRRETTGGASTSDTWPTGTPAVKAPYWVRITRTGNTFKAESSPDGKTWTALGASLDIAMPANVYIGLAVTSHNVNAYTTAEFSNVSTTGAVTGAWQNLSIGVTQKSNSPDPLYVTVEDKAGKKATVANPDPAAVTKNVWTQWQIALSDLKGINLAAVKKLTLGVGDRANPKTGGAGTLYFDDLGFGRPAAQ